MCRVNPTLLFCNTSSLYAFQNRSQEVQGYVIAVWGIIRKIPSYPTRYGGVSSSQKKQEEQKEALCPSPGSNRAHSCLFETDLYLWLGPCFSQYTFSADGTMPRCRQMLSNVIAWWINLEAKHIFCRSLQIGIKHSPLRALSGEFPDTSCQSSSILGTVVWLTMN